MIKSIIFFLALTILFSCSSNKNDNGVNENQSITIDSSLLRYIETPVAVNIQPPVPSRKEQIFKTGDSILQLLENKDYKKLSTYFHSQKGVIFSPYSNIDNSKLGITAEKFLEILSSNKKIVWGISEGSGDDILNDIPTYFKTYVYDENYRLLNTKYFNTPIQKSMELQNLKTVFPTQDFMNYYKPASPRLEFDYYNLLLIFEDENKVPKLVGIVHNQHTI